MLFILLTSLRAVGLHVSVGVVQVLAFCVAAGAAAVLWRRRWCLAVG